MGTHDSIKRKLTPSITTEASAETADANVYVLGGGTVGAAVARRLQSDGHAVALIDESYEPSDVLTSEGNPTDAAVMAEAGLADASTVIVATPVDSQNLLAAQLARTRFDVDRVIVRTNDPDRTELMTDGGHVSVCATTALSDALVDRL